MDINAAGEQAADVETGPEIVDAASAIEPEGPIYLRKIGIWGAIGVVFVLTAIGSFYLPIFADRPTRQLPAEHSLTTDAKSGAAQPSLGMRALRQADTILISWDPRAVTAKAATEGFLEVQDGPEQRHLPLGPSQISTGLMSYNARSADLLLRLEFRNARGDVMTQSMTLLGGTDAGESSLPKVTIPLADRTISERPKSGAREAIRSFKPAEIPAPDPAENAAPLKEIAASRLPDNAPVVGAFIASAPSQVDAALEGLAPKPGLPIPVPPAAPPTAVSQPTTVPIQPKPLILDPNAGNYTPPRPVKWGPPSAKKAKISLAAPVNVALKIHIDQFGNVTKVHAVNEGQKTSKDLMKLADESVRRWVFEPAKYKGKAIASEDTIVLRIEK